MTTNRMCNDYTSAHVKDRQLKAMNTSNPVHNSMHTIFLMRDSIIVELYQNMSV